MSWRICQEEEKGGRGGRRRGCDVKVNVPYHPRVMSHQSERFCRDRDQYLFTAFKVGVSKRKRSALGQLTRKQTQKKSNTTEERRKNNSKSND